MEVDGKRRNTVVLVQTLGCLLWLPPLLSKAETWDSNRSPPFSLGCSRKTLHVRAVSATVIFTPSLLPISAERLRVTCLLAAGYAVSFDQCAVLELQGCTNPKLLAAVSPSRFPPSST